MTFQQREAVLKAIQARGYALGVSFMRDLEDVLAANRLAITQAVSAPSVINSMVANLTDRIQHRLVARQGEAVSPYNALARTRVLAEELQCALKTGSPVKIKQDASNIAETALLIALVADDHVQHRQTEAL